MKHLEKRRKVKVTHLLRTFERVVRCERDGNEVLVCVNQGVRDGDDGRILEREGDGSDGLDTRQEAADQFLIIDIEDRRREDVALVEDLLDSHTVRERRDVQHVEQRRLGRADTRAGRDDLDIGDNFNRTTRDLRRDVESLEERRLARFHSCVSGGDDDVLRSEGASTCGRGDLVRNDRVSHFLQLAISEDETDVTLDEGEETFELRVLREDGTKSTSDHRVLAHQNNTLATERLTDLVHLVWTDIVDVYEED